MLTLAKSEYFMKPQWTAFDASKCYCKKSQYLNDQCPNKRKGDTFFCGIHSKSKKKYIFDPIVQKGILDPHGNIPSIKIDENENMQEMDEWIESLINENDHQNEKTCEMRMECETSKKKNDSVKIDKKKIYKTKEEFFTDLFVHQYDLSVYSIRQSIKHIGFIGSHDFIASTKLSRSSLIDELRKIYDKEKFYKKHESQIIRIQSFIRMIQTKEFKLRKCLNDTDILSFENIYEIPRDHLFIFYDSTSHFFYAYDIRTIEHILKMEKVLCPYTCREFSENEVFYLHYVVQDFKKKGIGMEIETISLSNTEKTEMRMRDIFHKINLLDNYTSFEWFKHLNLKQLERFYCIAEDIWVYRIQLTSSQRRNYVLHGRAFLTPKSVIRRTTDIDTLRNFCLDEIERFIIEGNTREEKKLGAMWMLTALVEVSNEASQALPHLVQLYDSD